MKCFSVVFNLFHRPTDTVVEAKSQNTVRQYTYHNKGQTK